MKIEKRIRLLEHQVKDLQHWRENMRKKQFENSLTPVKGELI